MGVTERRKRRNTPEKPRRREKRTGMKSALIAGLVTLAWASPAPQYSGQTQDLSEGQLDTIKDIFGTDAGDAYSGDQQTQGALTDKATSNVDNVFENCADYTESQGYECVPYYQCHNGTIITDGGGLIDIRNGFGILSPEDCKCPGFLDVCCLDPDFVPPPPPPIVKHVPKCGQRHENGLGVRIQGFNEYESQ